MPPGPQPSLWADGRGKWREGIRSSLLAAASVTSWSAVGGRPPGFTDAKSWYELGVDGQKRRRALGLVWTMSQDGGLCRVR